MTDEQKTIQINLKSYLNANLSHTFLGLPNNKENQQLIEQRIIQLIDSYLPFSVSNEELTISYPAADTINIKIDPGVLDKAIQANLN